MDADDLYALPPEAFTVARDAAAKQAKADGDRDAAAALKALRRPSVAAWLVNRLATGQRDLLDQLLDLGPELAQAQSGGDAPALRALGAQRRQLVDAVVGTAVTESHRSVSAAVREEVAGTLEAALSDPGSADAVRSGRLVRALSYAGFGEVDLSDAVAPRASTTKAAPAGRGTSKQQREADERAARVAAAEQAAHDAAGRLDDAVRACEQAERQREAAHARADAAVTAVERLEEQLVAARSARDEAAHAARTAADASAKAGAKVGRLQDAAEQAREELDRLRRD